MTITLTLDLDPTEVRTRLYETADKIAEALDRALDQAEVTAWTAEQWESHMVVMPETGPNLPVEVDA